MAATRFFTLILIFLTALLAPVTLSPLSAGGVESSYIVIGIDTSGSMRGIALERAIDAAERIKERLGDEKELEVYTFARTVIRLDGVAPPSTLESRGYTSLYDAIFELSSRADQLDAPLVIITDGQDSRSLLTPTDLIDRLAGLDVAINVIAYQPSYADQGVMNNIAASTGGGVFDVDTADQLITALEDVVIEIDTSQKPSSDRLIMVIASVTGLLSFSLLTLARKWRGKDRMLHSWNDFLGEYEAKSEVESTERFQIPSIVKPIQRWLGDTSQIFPKIGGSGRREFLVVTLLVALFFMFQVIGFSWILALIAAGFTFLLLLRFLVQRAESSARAAFEAELPGALKLIASSLTAGLSFLQALDTFSSESKTQVAREFRRALSEIQMGSTVEDAFGDVAHRMQSEDLRWVVFAFSVQREVGGSLAKILQTSAETIESRANLRQEVRTLSAEGRISSYILMLLPMVIFAFLLVIRPSFVSLFWEDSVGHLLLALILTLMILAWVWIRRLIRIEP